MMSTTDIADGGCRGFFIQPGRIACKYHGGHGNGDSVGCQQLPGQPGFGEGRGERLCHRDDSPEMFADKIRRLYSDETLRLRIGQANLVEIQKYATGNVLEEMKGIYQGYFLSGMEGGVQFADASVFVPFVFIAETFLLVLFRRTADSGRIFHPVFLACTCFL